MTRDRMTQDELAEKIGNHILCAEQLLGAAYPLPMTSMTSAEIAQISVAHSQLAIAYCLMEVWQEDVKPVSGTDGIDPGGPHPYRLQPGTGNLCEFCQGLPGDPRHLADAGLQIPGAPDATFPEESASR